MITGATSGIGYETLKEMLRQEATVIGTGRSTEKLARLSEEFSDYIKKKKLFVVQGDVSDNGNVLTLFKAIESRLRSLDRPLDILFNVAGIVRSGYEENADGNELTFATNHLAVYYLTGLLYPYLKKSQDPRVLVVSSLSHYRAFFDPKNIQSKRFYNVLRGYQRSKLYNVLYVKYVARFEKQIKFYAIDPGLVKTEIGDKHTKGIALRIWKIRKKGGVAPHIPAKHMADIATQDRYLKDHGAYMKLGNAYPSSRISNHESKQRILWEYSKKRTQFAYPFDREIRGDD